MNHKSEKLTSSCLPPYHLHMTLSMRISWHTGYYYISAVHSHVGDLPPPPANHTAPAGSMYANQQVRGVLLCTSLFPP